MFWCPMTDEIICKLQMREANANGSFEQQAISSPSRVYHANNKRKQNNKKIKRKQSNVKQKVNLDLNKAKQILK